MWRGLPYGKGLMKKRYSIQVRKYSNDRSSFEVMETILRVLRAEQIGNFCPVFCRYNNDKRCLVHSDLGDFSDPFRRSAEYGETLYIKV